MSRIIRTLVIGGGGYIGSSLVPELLKTGRQVSVLGRRTIPKYIMPNQVKYVIGNFSSHRLISRLLDDYDEVIHMAYATAPNTSFKNPLNDLLENIPPTIQLFAEVAKRDIKLVLISSGGAVYGEAKVLPIKETHQTKPISPYGVTKLALENYAFLYAATYGLKFICIRPGNAYGGGQQAFTGQGLIATAMQSAINGMPIEIFGDAIRDYIHVGDVVAGIVCALERGRCSEIYNLGSGVGFSNIDVVKSISSLIKEFGLVLQFKILPGRSFDVDVNVLNSKKLNEHTGWIPVVKFEDGLRRTFEGFREKDWL